MKNLLLISIFFLFCIETQGQAFLKESFFFENKKIEFKTLSSSRNDEFNFIIRDANVNPTKFYTELNRCSRKKPKPSFIFIIPKECSKRNDEIVLEFMSYVLSKRKLVDMQMNVISDKNYFKLYEDIRVKNKGKYKQSFLNKINKLLLIKSDENICNYLK